jgi:hypothetical protein
MLLSMPNHYQTRAPRRQNGAGWTLTFYGARDWRLDTVRQRCSFYVPTRKLERTMTEKAEHPNVVEATEQEIDAVIAEAGGDPRQAIQSLLHDMTQLARDSEAAVSRGYVRGRLFPIALRGILGKKGSL